MNRRRFLQVSGASVALALRPANSVVSAQAMTQATTGRGWLIYADQRLGIRGETLSQRALAAVDHSPLLTALSGGKPALQLDTSSTRSQIMEQLAYNHVILIAMADDPLLIHAWQREATVSPGAIYALGFGNCRGSLGYIESDRNPFLHAANIARAPFETQLIAITGTDSNGIELALDAFLQKGLVNGIVARNGEWNRPTPTLLDRDPLLPSFTLPAVLPNSLASLDRIAVTQAGEDEYRGVLADTGLKPLSIWRAKYHKAGQWDAPGEVAAFHNYAVGLHRRAYGNTVWVATFVSQSDASKAALSIAKAADLSPAGSRWQGNLPPYAWGVPASGDAPQTGTIELSVDEPCVLISSLTTAM